MAPKKSSSDEGKYAGMTVLELKKECRARTGMTAKDCNILRKPLVDLLVAQDRKASASKKSKPARGRTAEPTKKSSSKTKSKSSKSKSPSRSRSRSRSRSASRSASKSGRRPTVGKCNHDSCPDKFCVISSGACIGKTKKGTPLLAELTKIAKMSKSERDEIQTTDDGLLGSAAEIRAARRGSTSVSRKTKTPTPPRKAKTPPKAKKSGRSPKKAAPKKKGVAKCYEPEADDCESGKVCSAKSGRCIKDSAAARKNTIVLVVDGREIVGSEDIVRKLQKQLGGKIKGESPSASSSRSSSSRDDSDDDTDSSEDPIADESDEEIVFAPPRRSPSPRTASKSPRRPTIQIDADESDSEASSDTEEMVIPAPRQFKKREPSPKKAPRPASPKKPSPKRPSPKRPSPKRPSAAAARPSTREFGNSATELRRRDIQETFMSCLSSIR